MRRSALSETGGNIAALHQPDDRLVAQGLAQPPGQEAVGRAHDVQDAPDAADRANHTITLALVPTALPHGGGLALAGTF